MEKCSDDLHATKTATMIISNLGVPAHVCGYIYLREAVLLALKQPEIIYSVTKELYPEVAGRFDTTPSKVERGIRHAIQIAWNSGCIELMQADVVNPIYSLNNKPTNAQLIAMIADWIRLHPCDELTICK